MQWQQNRLLLQDRNRFEAISISQAKELEEQATRVHRLAADLDEFRGRLSLCESQLEETQSALAAATGERNQLRVVVNKWRDAVAERDAILKQTDQQIQKLLAERNEAIARFNELAGKWNRMTTAPSQGF